ncbi:MAG: phosphatidylserine decarboxylase [Bacteriovoracaceae bacterium]|nr:phosphatidylserine decarboxylase [Bacteriovoracaceae bacterium]
MDDTHKSSSEIKFWHRGHGQMETEKVYGDWFIRYLYDSSLGKKTGGMFANASFSKFYGLLQSLPTSHGKVRPFIEKFNIDIDQYEPGSKHSVDIRDSYSTFNEFFIRKFKLGQRPFVSDLSRMPAFSEARYVGYESITPEVRFPVKGKYLTAAGILGNGDVAKPFEGGPLIVARLCPVDYHRYHYPDNGKVIDHYPVHGRYDSVNPLALKLKNDIFIANERHVTLLQTENFGRLAYVEVGAICVGKIVQSHRWSKPFLRGEEKGYFLFGGSTVVLLGEKGAWKPSKDVLENTKNNTETYVTLGDEIAVKS